MKDLEHVALRAHPDLFQQTELKACEFELDKGWRNCDSQLRWQAPYHTIQVERCKKKRQSKTLQMLK